MDASDHTPHILSGIALVLTTVLGFIGVRLHNKADQHDNDITDLKARVAGMNGTYITRDELTQHIDRLQGDRQRMHDENKALNGENKELLERIFDKLDKQTMLEEKVRRNEQDIQTLLTAQKRTS